ncbi:MAG: hypothetical protein QW041_02815 [Candidatus Pacearchaeota archaeon]
MNYKSYWKKEEFILKEALLHVTIISIIVFAIAYFGKNFNHIGLILIAAGILPLISLKLTGEKIKESIAEIVFGFINTGLITLFAIIGYNIEGLLGAVIGVVLGDVITEGYSGILEGEVVDLMLRWKIKEKIDPLNSSLGKMAGALFGGGIVLLIF